MVLIRAVGWLLLAMAVAAAVHDGLAWWSEGSFRMVQLGEVWSRLEVGTFSGIDSVQRPLSGPLWTRLLMPFLRLPAFPALGIVGLFFVWIGRSREPRYESRSIIGSRPPRRRRNRGGLS